MISDNLREVRQELRDSCALASRQLKEVTLIAVTKTVDVDHTIELVEQGVHHLAENRADKFLDKKEKMADFPNVSWHFIGNLQRRKVKSVINEIDFFQVFKLYALIVVSRYIFYGYFLNHLLTFLSQVIVLVLPNSP